MRARNAPAVGLATFTATTSRSPSQPTLATVPFKTTEDGNVPPFVPFGAPEPALFRTACPMGCWRTCFKTGLLLFARLTSYRKRNCVEAAVSILPIRSGEVEAALG